MLNPKNVKNGQEQHEYFTNMFLKRRRCQYDYRHTDGELFSCIRSTLKECRAARDKWLAAKEDHKK